MSLGEANDDDNVCYVCHEPCRIRSQCLCAAHVHELCLLKTAIACDTDRCTICKGVVANLKLLRMCHRTRVEEEHREECELLLLCIACVLFSTLSLLFFAASTEELEHYAHLYALCCAASMSLAASASRAFCRRAEPLTFRAVTNLAVLL